MKHKLSEAELTKALSELPPRPLPETDLWPGVASQLGVQANPDPESAPTAAPRRLRLVSMVAALVLAVIAGFGIGQRYTLQPEPVSPLAFDNESAALEAMMPLLNGISSEYQGGIRELAANDLGTDILNAPNDEAQVRGAVYELAVLAAQINGGLKAQPSNQVLSRWLVRVEAEQFRLLRQLQQLDQKSRSVL